MNCMACSLYGQMCPSVWVWVCWWPWSWRNVTVRRHRLKIIVAWTKQAVSIQLAMTVGHYYVTLTLSLQTCIWLVQLVFIVMLYLPFLIWFDWFLSLFWVKISGLCLCLYVSVDVWIHENGCANISVNRSPFTITPAGFVHELKVGDVLKLKCTGTVGTLDRQTEVGLSSHVCSYCLSASWTMSVNLFLRTALSCCCCWFTLTKIWQYAMSSV